MKINRLIAFTVLIGLWRGPLGASTTAPDQPLGIKGVQDPWGRAFTLIWEPVKQKADGAPLTNLAGYNIYRRLTPRGTAQKINTYVVPISVFADRIDGKTFYYSIRAVDKNGVESAESFLLDSTPQSNLIVLADDGFTHVVIPGKVGDLLRPAHNKYGVPLTIRLKEELPTNNSAIVRNIRFQFARGDTKEEVTDLTFESPDVDINIGYNVVGGQVVLGAPGVQSFNNLSLTNAVPEQLSLFWFNGVTWIKLGGSNNPKEQIVNVKSAQLGNYQLRISAPASSLALTKANVYPGLFSPNGDGYNDRVYMVLENPNNSLIQGEIFDLSGRFVASLPAPTQTAGVGSTLAWAGQDSGGAVVPSGLYMYRIQGDGKVITGTVSVAR